MQEEKISYFKNVTGQLIRDIRESKEGLTINKISFEFDFDKGNLSKIERGIYSIHLITAWKISEALGMKFSEFAKMLEEKLGDDFSFFEE